MITLTWQRTAALHSTVYQDWIAQIHLIYGSGERDENENASSLRVEIYQHNDPQAVMVTYLDSWTQAEDWTANMLAALSASI